MHNQGYVQLIARGEADKAREMVRETLPFPEIISRICDAPCERKCHRNAVTGQPVSIRALKRYMFENDQSEQVAIPEKAGPSGKRIAVSVDRFLKGEHLKFNWAYAGPIVTEFEFDLSRGSDDDQVKPRLHPFKEAGDFHEVEQPYSIDEARKEAGRCYSCGGPFGQHRTCWFCLPCEVECPEEALWVEVPYLLR